MSYQLSNGNVTNEISGNADFEFSYFFGKHWGVGTGVGLAFYNNTASINNLTHVSSWQDEEGELFDLHSVFSEYSEKQKLAMLQIPVLLRLRAGVFRLNAGVKAGFPLSATSEGAGNVSNKGWYPSYGNWSAPLDFMGLGDYKYQHRQPLKLNTAWIAAFEMGVQPALSGKVALYFGVYLDYGLNDLAATHQDGWVDWNEAAPNHYAVRSVLTSAYSDGATTRSFTEKVTPLSAGVKMKLAFGKTGKTNKPRPQPAGDLSDTPKPILPPKLEIGHIEFTDANHNRLIDAGERCRITFTVSNKGTGSAYKLQIAVKETSGIQHLNITNVRNISELASGQSERLSVDVIAGMDIDSKQAVFEISALEGNGFDASDEKVRIKTQAFAPPKMVIADTKFSTPDGGSKVSPGELITLQIMVQNQGQGVAQQVNLTCSLPSENVFAADDREFDAGTLNAGEKRSFRFKFIINNRYTADDVPITLQLTESYGKYGDTKVAHLSLSRAIAKSSVVEVEGEYNRPKEIEKASLYSDVDINIPVNKTVKDHVFALVIGNEHYRMQQGTDVPFASNDAAIFKEYLNKTLGVPDANIRLLTDASKAQMETEIDRLCQLAKTYSKGKAEIIFYYAGHGLCDSDKAGFLIPVDVIGTQASRGIKLEEVYRKFGKLDDIKVTAFVDACFSGGARSGTLVAARGISVEPKQDAISGQLVVFTAASGNETAHPWEEQQHGIFTYYLLKKLQETSGKATYEELSDYLQSSVQHQALKIKYTQQTPKVLSSYELKDAWRKWTLR
ncbi:hypothetical protein FACS189430_08950 [Bacteroidia bacterium]|nr:hypothetical protein FACS189430_08950 [Bacteroidia bacterium]